jgi:quercetin dioxygenase-like cupin family protein
MKTTVVAGLPIGGARAAATVTSIENPVTGESMTFLLTGEDTSGELLRIDMRVQAGGFVSGEHIHPHQEERFSIDRGQITLRVDGNERRYGAGEQVAIPPGTPHVWWNSGSGELRVLLEFRPAGRFVEFITTHFALARAGRTNDRGIPTNPLQLAVTFAEYQDVVQATSPPGAVQRILFSALAPLGRLMGYKADVPYA